MTELSFGREYSAAIESKQVAQQEAQRAAFVVDRAIQEKQQKIVQAEGKSSSKFFQRRIQDEFKMSKIDTVRSLSSYTTYHFQVKPKQHHCLEKPFQRTLVTSN